MDAEEYLFMVQFYLFIHFLIRPLLARLKVHCPAPFEYIAPVVMVTSASSSSCPSKMLSFLAEGLATLVFHLRSPLRLARIIPLIMIGIKLYSLSNSIGPWVGGTGIYIKNLSFSSTKNATATQWPFFQISRSTHSVI